MNFQHLIAILQNQGADTGLYNRQSFLVSGLGSAPSSWIDLYIVAPRTPSLINGIWKTRGMLEFFYAGSKVDLETFLQHVPKEIADEILFNLDLFTNEIWI